MKTTLLSFLAMTAILSIAIAGETASPPTLATAFEVHTAVNEADNGEDSRMTVTLILRNRRGETRHRTLIRHRREATPKKTILCWLEPPDLRGTSTLTLEVKDEDDLQYIHLPAMKKIRRIPAGDKGKSWVGTDFTFEDLQEQNLDDWDYSDLTSETLDGHDCYVYTITPKRSDASIYGQIQNWVRKDIVRPLKARYADKKSVYFKELRFEDYQNIQGIWTCKSLIMEDFREQHRTDFIVRRVEYNTRIPDDMFSVRSMSTIPQVF